MFRSALAVLVLGLTLATAHAAPPRITFDDSAKRSARTQRWEIIYTSKSGKGGVKVYSTVTGTVLRAQVAVDAANAKYPGYSFAYRPAR